MTSVIALLNETSTQIASIEIQSAKEDLCTGVIRWQNGGAVRAELLELEELINDQVLPLVDEVQARVERMGLFFLWRGARVDVRDLQVYEDRDVSFRCDPTVVGELERALV